MSNFLKANSIKCHTDITEITDSLFSTTDHTDLHGFFYNIEKLEKTETPFRDSCS